LIALFFFRNRDFVLGLYFGLSADSSENDEDMQSEQGAGAATTAPTFFADLMARDSAGLMARDAINNTSNQAAIDSKTLNPGLGVKALGDDDEERDQD
jgi:hypothetical protein